ncbi:MAG: hypothetical protein JXJ17_07580 [Anaerolineae bacterium]|nr:hypothetical protein [Anaerolineae bacterium]
MKRPIFQPKADNPNPDRPQIGGEHFFTTGRFGERHCQLRADFEHVGRLDFIDRLRLAVTVTTTLSA